MNRTAILLAAAATAAVTLAGAPAASGQPAPANDRASVDHSASDVALAVEGRAAFGGIRVTPDHGAIEVYVTRHDPDLENAARAAAAGTPLRFTVVRHSYGALKGLSERIDHDHAALARDGIRITHGGVRDSGNRVVIGVENVTPEIRAEIARRYPGRPVEVVPGRFAKDISRLNDSAPWYSGDLMSPDGPDNDCTVGPAVKNSAGHRYLLTAGHCFRLSGSSGYIYRVFQGSDQVTYDDPVMMGYAKAENPGAGVSGYDLGVIDPTDGAFGYTWRSAYPTDSTPVTKQSGTFRASENTDVCFSGGYSGEQCGGSITFFDSYYYQADKGKVIHANLAYSRAGVLAGPGDSGGPVYQQRSDGLVYVAGVILATFDDGWPCPNQSFNYRGNLCSDEVWFGGIGSILNHTGTTLVVP